MLRSVRSKIEAALVGAAALFAAAGARTADPETADTFFFGAWLSALLLILSLGLRLPLRPRGAAWRPIAATAASVLAAAAVVLIANIALYRHDVHFDLTRTGRFTPPSELDAAAASLRYDVSLTYFYNADDEDARHAKDALLVLARQRVPLRVRLVDIDKEPAAARALGVRAYNTVVVEAQGRRIVLENTSDLRQVAYALLRVQRQETPTVCFVTGHGEPFERRPPHLHFSHVETLQGHQDPGAEDVLQGEPDGIDRLSLALDAFGFAVEGIAPALVDRIPVHCAIVAEIGPRSTYVPAESKILDDYLRRGGRLLLLLDPAFPVDAGLAALLGSVGFAVDAGTIIDPLNHLGTNEDQVAVPYYPPHPITDRIAMTVFPGARPVRLLPTADGIAVTALFASSGESRVRPATEPLDRPVGSADGQSPVAAKGPAIIAAAAEGRVPGAPPQAPPFRIVLVGNSQFVTNAFFPQVANGELAIGMVQWLAGAAAAARVTPETYSVREIALTNREMRRVFLVVEVLLPLSVALLGVGVWWRRR